MAPQGEVDLSSKRNCSVDSHMEWYQHDAPGGQRGPCSYNNIRCLRVVGCRAFTSSGEWVQLRLPEQWKEI